MSIASLKSAISGCGAFVGRVKVGIDLWSKLLAASEIEPGQFAPVGATESGFHLSVLKGSKIVIWIDPDLQPSAYQLPP